MINRFVIKNMPEFMKRKIAEQMYTCRPQMAFLPLDNTKSLVPAAHQPSLSAKAPVEDNAGKSVSAV